MGELMKPIVSDDFFNIISVILFTSVLFIIHTIYGGKRYFARRIVPMVKRLLKITESEAQDLGVYYKRVNAFILFIGFPFFIIRGIYNESLKNYGLSHPTDRLSPFLLFPVIIASFLVLLFFSRKKGLIQKYPEVKRARESRLHFALSCASYVLYFLGYENLYRGFLLFGLHTYTGDWTAVFISAGFTTLTHFRDPRLIVMGSLAAGVLFSYIALLTGSIWTVFILHSGIGIAMDYLCIRASVSPAAVRGSQEDDR